MKITQLLKLTILTLLAITLFTSCSEKSATKYSNKSPQYAQLAKYTKIGKIVVDGEVKAIANITYLNGAQSQKWDDGFQHFLVGFYGLGDTTPEISLQMFWDQKLIPLVTQEDLQKDHPLYNHIPFRNNWATYKLVKFVDIKDEHKMMIRFMLSDEEYHDTVFVKE